MSIWYAIRTRGQRELDVGQDLRKEGHTVFVPTELVRKPSRTGRPKEITRAIVNGYVFADHPWHTHKYVLGVVMMGGEPIAIPDAAMVPLFHATGRLVDHTPKTRAIGIGDVIRIALGPHAGQDAVVSRIVKGKLETTVRLFGRDMTVLVPKSQVAA